ncbi:putative ribonuclease H-like domain-containing protein [Tanacetum coccineum]
MQKTFLKQQYKNFTASRSKGLDKTYDRFQKLISQLEVHGEFISQEDANLKLLRSLPSAWNNIALIMRKKADLDELSIDDLYNNLKEGIEFQSKKPWLDKTPVECYTATGEVLCMRIHAPRNKGIDKRSTKKDCTSRDSCKCLGCSRWDRLESLEARIVVHQKNEAVYEEDIAFLKYDVKVRDNSITELKNQLAEALREKDDLKLKLEKFETSSMKLTKLINSQISVNNKSGVGFDSQMNENELHDCHLNKSEVFESASDSSVNEIEEENNQVNDRFKKVEGYHAVPPPYTGNYMPSRPDLSFAGLDDSVYKTNVSETISSVPRIESTASKSSKDSLEQPKDVRPSAPIIEEWESDCDDDCVIRPSFEQNKPSYAKINFVKSDENTRKSVIEQHTYRQAENLRKSQSPRVDKRNWNGIMTQKLGDGFEFNKKACFVCGSLNHLIKDCNFYKNKTVRKSMLNNMGRVIGQREVRPVWNNAQRVNHQNKLTHPHPKRNFVPTIVATKSGLVPVNAVKQSSPRVAASISTAGHVNTTALKQKVNAASPIEYSYFKAHSPLKGPFNQKSAAKTNNFNKKVYTAKVNNVTTAGPEVVSFLTDYQEVDGGFVAFAGSPKGGKITRKCKIGTGKLDFEDVYFVKKLKFNLFSVSQMYDKKNSVLFTETKCLVLSPDFKQLDESQVLLKVHRQNNMYNFDLKNIVPLGGLTCLIAKATIDESNLWHRRLGHINFKTMNKLLRGNLVRGLPSKLFENDHSCVACQKRKQHKTSCKTKLVSSISHPLQMFHMDLFRPTFIRSINHKIYCLVVTDDYSRFSWVIFLATKDETSEILKTFITGIENQINHKVKIIRCDNGTKFKNNDMNQFCGMKGIKREFSVARTPQQNGVAERKNRTLIEAARTMLADSLLPTTFWVEVADEGFLVGYSINSKSFRVFNTRTKKVKENLHINFLENKPNVTRSGPEWLFDIDSLTKSMNYEPVTTGNQSNGDAGIETNVNAGQVGQEKASDHEYILLPLMLSNSPLSSSSQSTDNKDANEPSINIASENINTGSSNINTASPIPKDLNNKDADEVPRKRDDDLSERNGQEKEERASNKEDDQHVQDFRAELDNLLVQQKEGYANNNNKFSAVNPSVSAAGQDFDNTNDQERIDSSTQDVNTIGSSINTATENINTGSSNINTASPIPNDQSLQSLEETGIFDDAYDDREEVGAEADLNSLVIQALTDPSWIEAMQEELLQFKLQKVWTPVDLPKGKRAIGTKWVYRNKKDERGIVVRNKARLVAQGYTQEEGIDYDEVFAHVSRIEAIRLFLAYASFMGLIVYQIDFPDKVYKVEKALYGLHQAPRAWYETLSIYLLKNGYRRGTINKILFIKKDRGDILLVQVYVNDIIFGSTKKSLCVEFEQMMHKIFQISSMRELTFFLGLQVQQKEDGIFISQDKYVDDILKKFDFTTIKAASTLI